jgi:predicted regulator of amino acid metabolism with ACT domain
LTLFAISVVRVNHHPESKRNIIGLFWKHGVSLERVLSHLHRDAMMPPPTIADALNVSRKPLAEWFQRVDVHKRSQ